MSIEKVRAYMRQFNIEDRIIEVDYNRIQAWLGVEIPAPESIKILNNLGIEVTQNDNMFLCKVYSTFVRHSK